MATTSNSRKKKPVSKNTKTDKRVKKVNTQPRQRTEKERMISSELSLLILLAITLLLFLCNFGLIGPVGNAVSGFMFGMFGLLAYIVPVFTFLVTAFIISNKENLLAIIKVISCITIFFVLGMILHLLQANLDVNIGYSIAEMYQLGKMEKKGGGIIFGSFSYLLFSLLDKTGSILVLIVLFLASLIIITEKSFFRGLKKGGHYVVSSAKDDARYRREQARIRKEERQIEQARKLEEEEQRLLKKREEDQALEADKILRMDKKVSGVMMDTNLKKNVSNSKIRKENIHEITIHDLEEISKVEEKLSMPKSPEFDFSQIQVHGVHQIEVEKIHEIPSLQEDEIKKEDFQYNDIEEEAKDERFESILPETVSKRERPVAILNQVSEKEKFLEEAGLNKTEEKKTEGKEAEYRFPPITYLKKMDSSKNQQGSQHLKETAMRLQQTLLNFGVKVTITDISQGPSVTRYELQPEQGVKVSKIVGLTDDIKLNLAATDIRMEAPIPGKAAIGIEVPNKENSAVGLRDLLESKEYKEFPSKLCFAVGKDIAGKVIVADIAKMPHMLIAGSTGSGKSVCINTLIMSLLYKATPEEVKLIMIDPKVVELSVYNGIPHLLIPVVTDPKKAAAALHWGVAEMTERYQKFADFNVRDLKGYNQEVERRISRGEEGSFTKMPQIVIIVDELADLMMVAPGEVEESICRLAQLARAAGIHLIIATQRPSVDVITGLIKANMPSRVAFAVSSGVDSRTILDMNGAEKLLGKGDMLFYPQGYPKPTRIQGAFVSDEEVGNIVDFLKNQNLGNHYKEEVEDKIKNIGISSSQSFSAGEEERDSYFIEAAKFMIEKDKASIGMLQRVFKIGFNRAARIMDQLAQAGVVGEEEGTKPRKILMSMEDFEQYLEEYM